MGSLAIAGIKDCSQLRLLAMTPQDELPLSSQAPVPKPWYHFNLALLLKSLLCTVRPLRA